MLAPTLVAPYRYRQTLIIRITGQRALEPVISALNEFTELRVLRVVGLRVLDPGRSGSLAAVTVEHLWWDRLSGALAGSTWRSTMRRVVLAVGEESGPGVAQLDQI